MKSKSIDFNQLLKAANLLVAALLAVTFSLKGGNDYIDQTTIVLAILLCLQTQIGLMLERNRRDPFVILLAFDMIFFFALRIVTLTLYPYSVVFDRYGFDAGNSNFALVFILIANTAFYAGLYLARSVNTPRIDPIGWKASSPARAVALMIAALLFAYFSGGYWNQETIPRAFSFLSIFLTPSITLLMSLAYYLLFRKTLSRTFAFSIGALIVADAVIHTLSGSRGAIIVILQDVIIITLAISGCIKLARHYVLVSIALLPAIVALLIATFVVSTYNRSAKDEGRPLDLGRALELAADASAGLSVESELDLLLPPIAGRAGYFDFSAEIMANRDKYASVLTVSSYAKSIVDNVLTPGFDVFDQPKISNALKFFYQGLGTPSKELVGEDNYQSDQLGIYGEFYGLFGYASLPLFFLVAFAFKRVYAKLTSQNPFNLAVRRAIILLTFVRSIDSYGIDWTILEILPFVAALYVYRPFFASKPVSVESERVPRPPLTGGLALRGE
jgi:hypothetical protein